MANIVSELEVVIGANLTKLKRGLRDSDREVEGFAARVGDKALKVGTQIAAIGVGAGVGIAGWAINAAASFESSFADVKKTVDATDEQLNALRDTIRDMATDESNPLSALDNAHETLTQIAASAGALGIAVDDIDEFVQTVGAMTVATDLGADAAADFLARFANITGIDVSNFDEVGDVIVELGNSMAATESEIAAFAMRLAPLAQFDFSPQEILGYSSALASLGVSAELGGTNMLKSVNDMVRAVATGKGLQDFADTAGMTADAFRELAESDPSAAFNAFIEGLGEMEGSEALKTLESLGITSVEQQRVLLAMAAGYDTVTQGIDTANNAWEHSNALMDEAQAKADTTEGAINRMKNQLNDTGISIGDNLLPSFNLLVQGLTDLSGGDWSALGTTLAGVVTTLTSLVGIDFFDILGGAQAWVGVFEMAWGSLQIIMDNIIRGITRWSLDLQLRILDFAMDLRQRILNISGVDIAPTLDVTMGEVMVQMGQLNTADAIGQSLNAQLAAGGPITLGAMVDFDPTITGDEVSLDSLLNMAQFTPEGIQGLANSMSVSGKMAIEDALMHLAAAGDEGQFNQLVPLALALDIPTEQIWQDAQAAIHAGINDQSFTATAHVSVMVEPELNLSQLNASLNLGGGGKTGTGNTLVPSFDGGGEFHTNSSKGGPAWLHDDETVRTPEQERALGRRGQGRGGDTYVVNSYGQNPYELTRLIERANRDSA